VRRLQSGKIHLQPITLPGITGTETACCLIKQRPCKNWVLPEAFDRLRRLLEVRMERSGRKEYIQVLRLLENFSQVQVEQAIKQAVGLGVVGFDAIKHLILCAAER